MYFSNEKVLPTDAYFKMFDHIWLVLGYNENTYSNISVPIPYLGEPQESKPRPIIV